MINAGQTFDRDIKVINEMSRFQFLRQSGPDCTTKIAQSCASRESQYSRRSR